MEDLSKLNYLYKIEEILRHGEINSRKESTAEHITTSLILANYFMEVIPEKLNYKRVTQMLLFHDLVEIEAKDTFILDDVNLKTVDEREAKAFQIVYEKTPKVLQEIYQSSWEEFSDNETREAQFVRAIDELDPMVQAFDKKYIWQKYKFTEEKLRSKKQKTISEFPILLKFFEELLTYFKENGYFD